MDNYVQVNKEAHWKPDVVMVTTLEVVMLVPEMTTPDSHQTVDYLGSQYIFSEM